MTEDASTQSSAARNIAAILDEDNVVLECPLCDGQIVRSEAGALFCDMCENEWSAADVAARNRL